MSESYAGKINRKLLKSAALSTPPPGGSRRTWC